MLHVFVDRFHDPLQTCSEGPHSSSACHSLTTHAAAALPGLITRTHTTMLVQKVNQSSNHMLIAKSLLTLRVHVNPVTESIQEQSKTRYNQTVEWFKHLPCYNQCIKQ